MSCVVCTATAPEGIQFCSACDARLLDHLLSIPELLEDLLITETRQDKIGSSNGGGGKSGIIPLPFNEQAAVAANRLHYVLGYWQCDAEDMPILRTHPGALQLWLDIDSAVRQGRKVIDRPGDRVFAGPCSTKGVDGLCMADLYARPGKAVVACRNCGAEHDVQSRRDWMLATIHDQTADAGLLASILTALGLKLHSSTIHKYAGDGLLEVKERDAKGTALYRIGDVLEIFYAKKARQGKKKVLIPA